MRNTTIKRLLFTLFLLLPTLGVADQYDEAMAILTEGGYSQAYRSLKRLAKRDHVEAQYQLGILYLFGKGVGQDSQQGVSWLKQAAQGGFYQAANELSQIYLAGKWVEQNETEGIEWLEVATKIAEQNSGEAEDGCE